MTGNKDGERICSHNYLQNHLYRPRSSQIDQINRNDKVDKVDFFFKDENLDNVEKPTTVNIVDKVYSIDNHCSVDNVDMVDNFEKWTKLTILSISTKSIY